MNYPSNSFRFNGRLLAVSFLVIAAMLLAYFSFISSSFADEGNLPENHIHYAAVTYAKQEEILTGYNGDPLDIRPNNRITRAEIAAMITRGLPDGEQRAEECLKNHISADQGGLYPDVSNDDWPAKYACLMREEKIMEGNPDGTFNPHAYIDYAQMARVMSEAFDKEELPKEGASEWFAGYINTMANERVIPLSVTGPEHQPMRSEVAQSIYWIKEQPDNRLSASYNQVMDPLPVVESCPAFHRLVVDSWNQSDYLSYYPNLPRTGGGGGFGFFNAPQGGLALTGGGGGEFEDAMDEAFSDEFDFSGTNIQVTGVDEADVVKNDGDYIYSISPSTGESVQLIRAVPVEEMKVLAEYKFPDFHPQGLYVRNTEDQKELVIIGELKEEQETDEILEGQWQGFYNKTQVHVLNITEPSQPKLLHKLTLDGDLTSSRLLMEQEALYLISQSTINLRDVNDSEAMNGADFIPRVQMGNEAFKPALNCADVRYTKFLSPKLLTVTRLNLDDGDVDTTAVFGAGAKETYVSRDAMYVSEKGRLEVYTDLGESDIPSTRIFKFDLTGNQPVFKGHGDVPGYALDQFSFSEHNDFLRVTTTSNADWRSDPTNGLYILDPNMKSAGQVTDLAKGETIRSSRFMGDRGYMVTFERIDPLFAFDLSDPYNPHLIGELKIPGFSEYLHPFMDDFLIGVGRDADEETGRLGSGKIALFDVSNPRRLREVDSVIFGEYGDLDTNHKSILFSPDRFGEDHALLAFQGEAELLTFPDNPECANYDVNECPLDICALGSGEMMCSVIEGGGEVCSSEPICESRDFTTQPFDGTFVYGVTPYGFVEKGRVSHYDFDDLGDLIELFEYDSNKSIYRSLWIGDTLYTLSGSGIQANDLMNLDVVQGLVKLVTGQE